MNVPAEIGELTNLEDLDLSENNLQRVAPELRALSQMVKLDLARNELENLPPLIGMADEVLGKMKNLQVLDVSNNKLSFLPLDLRLCSSLTDLHVFGNPLKHPAIVRAQVPCLGSLKVNLEELSGVTYFNKANQKARVMGNPICTVGLEGGKSGTVEQVQETSCKVETDHPFFRQSFPLVIRDCHKDISIRLHTKPSTVQRMVDQKAPLTPLRGLNVCIPVLFPLLYQLPLFNFFRQETLRECVSGLSLLQYQTSEDVVSMGDKAGAMYILLFGKLSMSQTQLDGSESVVGEIAPGQVAGEGSLLCDDAFPVTLIALEFSVVVKVPIAAVSPVLKNQPLRTVECLLYHEAIAYHEDDANHELEQKEVVWGSAQWDKLRRMENASLHARLEAICRVHVFSHDQTNDAKGHVELIASKMNGDGKPVFAFAKDPSYVNLGMTVEFVGDEVSAHSSEVVKAADPPKAKMSVEFHCSDRVESYFLAFRQIESAVEPDEYAMALLKRYATVQTATAVRPTPDGIMFDVEKDWLRQNAEVARIDAYLTELHNDKRRNRGAPVWEKMPLMFFVDGVFDREWDRAADRRAEYSSGNFREMGNLVEKMRADDRVSDLKSKDPHRNQRLWRHVEKFDDAQYKRQSIPEEGAEFNFFREGPPPRRAALRADPVESWKVLVGLLLVKPQALLDKEKSTHGEENFHGQNLAAIHALQSHAGLKQQVKGLKVQLGDILEQMDNERAIIKEQFVVLKGGWNGDAVAAIKTSRKQIQALEKAFEAVSQSKDRIKALYKLRQSSSSALRWKGKQALDAVWEAMAQYTDPEVDRVMAGSNALGGPMDPALVAVVTVADKVHPLDLIEVEDILRWVDADQDLSKIPSIATQVKAGLQAQQITGRMLMHLSKGDLMRMGLKGPVARLVLVRIEAFKEAQNLGELKHDINKQHSLSAQLALLATDAQVNSFLKSEFELEDRQVKLFRKTFSKFDLEGRGEVDVQDLTAAAASCGTKLHPQILKASKKKYDPDDSGTLDLVCFVQIMKAALMTG